MRCRVRFCKGRGRCDEWGRVGVSIAWEQVGRDVRQSSARSRGVGYIFLPKFSSGFFTSTSQNSQPCEQSTSMRPSEGNRSASLPSEIRLSCRNLLQGIRGVPLAIGDDSRLANFPFVFSSPSRTPLQHFARACRLQPPGRMQVWTMKQY